MDEENTRKDVAVAGSAAEEHCVGTPACMENFIGEVFSYPSCDMYGASDKGTFATQIDAEKAAELREGCDLPIWGLQKTVGYRYLVAGYVTAMEMIQRGIRSNKPVALYEMNRAIPEIRDGKCSHHNYELIPNRITPWFDMEYMYADNPDMPKRGTPERRALIRELVEFVFATFKHAFRREESDIPFVLCEGQRPLEVPSYVRFRPLILESDHEDKFSIHMIIRVHFIQDGIATPVAFRSLLDFGKFCSLYVLPPDLHTPCASESNTPFPSKWWVKGKRGVLSRIIDSGVFTRNRLLRTPGADKIQNKDAPPRLPAPLMPYDWRNLESLEGAPTFSPAISLLHFVTYFPPSMDICVLTAHPGVPVPSFSRAEHSEATTPSEASASRKRKFGEMSRPANRSTRWTSVSVFDKAFASLSPLLRQLETEYGLGWNLRDHILHNTESLQSRRVMTADLLIPTRDHNCSIYASFDPEKPNSIPRLPKKNALQKHKSNHVFLQIDLVTRMAWIQCRNQECQERGFKLVDEYRSVFRVEEAQQRCNEIEDILRVKYLTREVVAELQTLRRPYEAPEIATPWGKRPRGL